MRFLTAFLVGLGLSACGDTPAVEPFEPITKPDRLFMQLALNHRAVNLSTAPGYTTLQLTATPLDGTGAPMTELPAPTFYSSDPTTVQVTPEGLVTALRAGEGVKVIAELAAPGNMKHADTAIVNVHATTDPPPELTTFAIDPVEPDSAILALPMSTGDFNVDFWVSLSIATEDPLNWSIPRRTRRLNAIGDTIPGLAVEYVSLDPTIAAINRQTGRITPLRVGTVRLVARTFAYGVSKEATAEFAVTPPIAQAVKVKTWGGTLSMFGPPIVIRPYGVVFWLNTLQPVEVVFDNPAVATQPPDTVCALGSALGNSGACGAGNFVSAPAAFPSQSAHVRQFTTPGAHRFRDAQTGAVGTIIVTNGEDT